MLIEQPAAELLLLLDIIATAVSSPRSGVSYHTLSIPAAFSTYTVGAVKTRQPETASS